MTRLKIWVASGIIRFRISTTFALIEKPCAIAGALYDWNLCCILGSLWYVEKPVIHMLEQPEQRCNVTRWTHFGPSYRLVIFDICALHAKDKLIYLNLCES